VSFESYIAKRYFRSGRFFINVSTWITIAGVTLGVATVCFVMSMHNGFEAEIRNRLLGTTSHISIFPLRGPYIEDYSDVIAKVEKIPGVVAASPFIYYKAAISSTSEGDGIIIRGIDIDLESKTANIQKDIKEGQLSFATTLIEGDSVPGIILGSSLAERLGVSIGSPVKLYSLKGENIRKNITPRIGLFYVSGIFETGFYEYDAEMAYISLQSAQKLFMTGDVATTVHLKLTDVFAADQIAPAVDSVLGRHYDVITWRVLNKKLFTWIAIEKLVLGLGFILIVVVAGFSIISTLVMLTMEKRSEIGILKTMGTTPGGIRKIFVYKGLLIASTGVLSGWIIALGLAVLQNQYKLISLPPDIYFISYLPIEMHWMDFLASGLVTFVICFLAALYPASQAAKLPVVEVLRQ
jgi:lipoprotein-releasing system permease protein